MKNWSLINSLWFDRFCSIVVIMICRSQSLIKLIAQWEIIIGNCAAFIASFITKFFALHWYDRIQVIFLCAPTFSCFWNEILHFVVATGSYNMICSIRYLYVYFRVAPTVNHSCTFIRIKRPINSKQTYNQSCLQSHGSIFRRIICSFFYRFFYLFSLFNCHIFVFLCSRSRSLRSQFENCKPDIEKLKREKNYNRPVMLTCPIKWVCF